MSTQPLWFDSHCHFDFSVFDSTRDEHWRLAKALGVRGLIIPGISQAQGRQLAAFCAHQPWFYALGLHPYFLAEHQLAHLDWLAHALAQDKQVLAVGEIGLDSVLASSDLERQQQWQYFDAQVQLAKAHKKPLVLHVRGMHDDMCSHLRKQQFSHGGLVHAFSGSEQQGKAWLNLGFSLGIGGAMSHVRAQRLRKTIKALPLESWLLETDSPDMKPAFWRNEHNSPAALPLLAAMLAVMHQVNLDELALRQQQTLLQHFPQLAFCFAKDRVI